MGGGECHAYISNLLILIHHIPRNNLFINLYLLRLFFSVILRVNLEKTFSLLDRKYKESWPSHLTSTQVGEDLKSDKSTEIKSLIATCYLKSPYLVCLLYTLSHIQIDTKNLG